MIEELRTFACPFDGSPALPTLSFIVAQDEGRARELIDRELLPLQRHCTVEIFEGGKGLSVEDVKGAEVEGA